MIYIVKNPIVIIVVFVLGVAIGFLIDHTKIDNISSFYETIFYDFTTPNPTPTTSTTAPEKRILFVGNSHTSVNDVPSIVVNMASSVAKEKYNYKVDKIVFGGARLIEHWKRKKVEEIVGKEKWDFVVLQHQSAIAIRDPESFNQAIQNFSQVIQKSGAKMIIFSPHARHHTNDMYAEYVLLQKLDGQCQTEVMQVYDFDPPQNPEDLSQRNRVMSYKASEQYGGTVVDTGHYWLEAQKQYPDIVLHQKDGNHATYYGSYLTALLLYRTFSGYSPLDVTYFPKKGTQENFVALQRITIK